METIAYILLFAIVLFLAASEVRTRIKNKQIWNMLKERIDKVEETISDLYYIIEYILDKDESLQKVDPAMDIIIDGDKDDIDKIYYDSSITEEGKNSHAAYKRELYNQIKDLKDVGHTEDEIARKLGIGRGEVKLIIHMHKSKIKPNKDGKQGTE